MYFKNFGAEATDQDILHFFQSATGLTMQPEIRVVHDRQTGKRRGIGFCDFKDASTAKLAVQKANGNLHCGRTIEVEEIVLRRRFVANYSVDKTAVKQEKIDTAQTTSTAKESRPQRRDQRAEINSDSSLRPRNGRSEQ